MKFKATLLLILTSSFTNAVGQDERGRMLRTIDGTYSNFTADSEIGIVHGGLPEYFPVSDSVIVRIGGAISSIENAKRGDRVIATYDNKLKKVVRLSFPGASTRSSEEARTDDGTASDEEDRIRVRTGARTTANTKPRTEARTDHRTGNSGRQDSGVSTSGSSSGGASVVGTSATGKPLHVGPRGGVYHYSKNGNKVYHSRKK